MPKMTCSFIHSVSHGTLSKSRVCGRRCHRCQLERELAVQESDRLQTSKQTYATFTSLMARERERCTRAEGKGDGV